MRKNMNTDIINKLKNLEQKILEDNINILSRDTKEWGGADVIISGKLRKDDLKWLSNENIIISIQETTPKKRLVVTKYSKELSWLFYQLRDIFISKNDCISKYDFYGILAQTAINYINNNKGKIFAEKLLLCVLNSSRSFV